MNVMSQLVSQDGLDLVVENSSMSVSPSTMRRVLPMPVNAALADFVRLDMSNLKTPCTFVLARSASASRRFRQFLVFVSERDVLVEQRHDQDRRKVGEQNREDQHPACRPQPPQVAGGAQGEVKQFEQDQAEGRADRNSLELVDDPAFERLVRLTETMRQDESAVITEREVDEEIEPPKTATKAGTRSHSLVVSVVSHSRNETAQPRNNQARA
jgi:hypothetical protein